MYDSTQMTAEAIIMLAAAVLQIILFFIIWGMTNNVSKIKNVVAPVSGDKKFKLRVLLLKGKKEEAKEVLINDFLNTIYATSGQTFFDDKKALNNNLEKIGETMPEYIAFLKTYNDFQRLFK